MAPLPDQPGAGCFFACTVDGEAAIMTLHMVPFWYPKAPDFIFGLTIGLSIALACHWVAWTIH